MEARTAVIQPNDAAEPSCRPQSIEFLTIRAIHPCSSGHVSCTEAPEIQDDIEPVKMPLPELLHQITKPPTQRADHNDQSLPRCNDSFCTSVDRLHPLSNTFGRFGVIWNAHLSELSMQNPANKSFSISKQTAVLPK